MANVLVDSSVWIDYLSGQFKPQTSLLTAALDRDEVITGDLVLMEIVQGMRTDMQVRGVLDLFAPVPCYTLGGREMAISASQNYRLLRKRGVTVRKSIDVLIATWCIENDVALLHADRDFDVMETLGLKVVE